MNRLKFIVLLALAIAGAIVAGPSSWRLVSAQAPGAGDGAISADQLREWLTYIASDELEGRATFSEGLARAGATSQPNWPKPAWSRRATTGRTSSESACSGSVAPTTRR